MLFAFSTASSGVRNVWIARTGPKISSLAIRKLCATFVKKRRREPEALRRERAGRLRQDRPVVDAGVDELADLLELHLRVDRADVGVLVERVAEAERPDPLRELPHDEVVDRLLDEEARARRSRRAPG